MAASISRRIIRSFGSLTALGRNSSPSIYSISLFPCFRLLQIRCKFCSFDLWLLLCLFGTDFSANGLSSLSSDLKVGDWAPLSTWLVIFLFWVFHYFEMLISFLSSLQCGVALLSNRKLSTSILTPDSSGDAFPYDLLTKKTAISPERTLGRK